MAIWNVGNEPVIELINWKVYKTETGDKHFVGYNEAGSEGRVSSAIKSFNKDTNEGVTSSGRIYKLFGETGYDSDAEYVWESWKEVNKVITFENVSEEDWGDLLFNG